MLYLLKPPSTLSTSRWLPFLLLTLVGCGSLPHTTPNPGPVPFVRAAATGQQGVSMVALDATGPDLSLPLPPDGITVFADIARNPKNGAMYAITNSSLHVLNMQTGRDTLQGLLKVADMTALAFDLGGHLYAGSRSGRLYQVDQGTGKTTQIGTGQTTPAIAGDLAFSHDGTLYASVLAGTSDQLVTINVSTGEATPVGLIGFGQVYGLTFRGEMLYGMTEAGALIWIDRETGRGTLVRRTGLTATGME